MTDPRSGFSDNLILWELKKIDETLTKTKEEHEEEYDINVCINRIHCC